MFANLSSAVAWCKHWFAPPSTKEPWDLLPKEKATPDELIAGALINSFGREFDNWKLELKPSTPTRDHQITFYSRRPSIRSDQEFLEQVKKEQAEVDAWMKKRVDRCGEGRFSINRALTNGKWTLVWYYVADNVSHNYFYVNDVAIPKEIGNIIVNSYDRINKQRAELKAAEAKALLTMKQEEKKWNLVEDMLGMVRNEFGALVPKETVSE